MALALKAALGREPPTAGLGAAQGFTFAVGLSSKYLHLPLAALGVSLIRSRCSFITAWLIGIFAFFLFNRLLNPNVFTGGFHWLVRVATHKGNYGTGESGFIDFNTFWPNMGEIILAAPLVSAVFAIGLVVALARMLTSSRYLDPISLTLVASFLAFAVQLVATSKHFALHYMMASWALAGGVLVLTAVEFGRLFPERFRAVSRLPPRRWSVWLSFPQPCWTSEARRSPRRRLTVSEQSCRRPSWRLGRPVPTCRGCSCGHRKTS